MKHGYLTYHFGWILLFIALRGVRLVGRRMCLTANAGCAENRANNKTVKAHHSSKGLQHHHHLGI